MSPTYFYATTALGLCFAMSPLTALAQSSATSPDVVSMFMPQVRVCIDAPADAACAPLRAVLAECAGHLEPADCGFLFVDADAVFSDSAQVEQAQRVLGQTSEAMAQGGSGAAAIDADAERLAVALTGADAAQAGGIAANAPEVVIAGAPEEEFVAPADPLREPDAGQQAALDSLMENPEVAAAVLLLGSAVDELDEGETQDPSRIRFSEALFALQRAQSGDAAGAEGPEAEAVTDHATTAGEIRASRDDFASRLTLDYEAGPIWPGDRSVLERAGLSALGSLAIGMNVNRNRVVARSDERVVVMRDNGEYAIWRDDDAILGEAGSQRWVERYADGSTLTRWERHDGSWIITIRDATGRALWRERILPDGTSIALINDMREVAAVNVAALPPLRRRELRIDEGTDPDTALSLLHEAEADARALDRPFSLRQVREIRGLRELLPILSPFPIIFESNRADVRAEEAAKLTQVGEMMASLIATNPRELFLVEGHTDAAGPAAYNLGLSDRRAESVALALTERFDIRPDNLIIQGYGERYLLIPTATAEARNRYVAIRRISPLLGP